MSCSTGTDPVGSLFLSSHCAHAVSIPGSATQSDGSRHHAATFQHMCWQCMPCVCKKLWSKKHWCKAVIYMIRRARQLPDIAQHTAVLFGWSKQRSHLSMHVGCLQGLLSGMLVCQCCLQQCQLLMQSCRLSLLPVLLHNTANLVPKSPAVSLSHGCTMACKDAERTIRH
jgi:hypothetical protein